MMDESFHLGTLALASLESVSRIDGTVMWMTSLAVEIWPISGRNDSPGSMTHHACPPFGASLQGRKCAVRCVAAFIRSQGGHQWQHKRQPNSHGAGGHQVWRNNLGPALELGCQVPKSNGFHEQWLDAKFGFFGIHGWNLQDELGIWAASWQGQMVKPSF